MRITSLLIGVLVFASPSFAQKATNPVIQSQTQVLPTLAIKPVPLKPEEHSVEQNAQSQASRIRLWEEQSKQWGITVEDWARYEDLKKGPRGTWSPSLDPLTMLGVEARSENERVRYAQIQVRMEAERVERELAYQRTYDQVFQKVYAGLLPINAAPPPKSKTPPPKMALFVKANCPECDKKAKKLQADKTPYDVYMIGTGGKDSVIRDWAKSVGISSTLVQNKTITLNHDNGTLQSVGGSPEKLPAVYQMIESTGLWVRTE